MAVNKINTKAKGKDEKSKSNKGIAQTNEDTEDIDFAILRRSVPTSITGFAQARKIFDLATEELKDLLSNECDLLFECKVCRNMFRSLANYVSHKRVFCKEKFNTSRHGHFVKTISTEHELLKIKSVEEGYQEAMRKKNGLEPMDADDLDGRIPLTKDLTAVIEKITKTKGIQKASDEYQDVVLQKIPNSSVAVFQNVNFSAQEEPDGMRAQVNELNDILSRDKAVLQRDGNFAIESSKDSDKTGPENESVIQISDDDESDAVVLKCKICDLQFSTQKTLKFHMKYKHLESRLVYPCPDCLDIFSTSWSVYRHLFKVHRKSAAQIRRLRESIQAKAFKMNNPPAFYEKRKNTIKTAPAQKITEEERLEQENQAWMDNMEGDGEVPRCGGCGRTFERRAALAAHTHTCQPRSRALARRPEGKKIEIQIRKDYNKAPAASLTMLKPADSNDMKIPNEDSQSSIKSQDESDKNTEVEDKEPDDAPMDVAEDDQKSNDSIELPEKTAEPEPQDDLKPKMRLPFALQAEKSNLAAFKHRIQGEIDFCKLLCKKCDIQLGTAPELFEHMADHFKWMRYACKLCNYKHYKFENLPEHVKVVHKLKGDSDFYFSTVKAIDGTEAMISSRCLVESESTEEVNDVTETSPSSRRPSRGSSDSSRLSDDSSSSSTLKETGTRKRKMNSNKDSGKRKKRTLVYEDDDEPKDGEMSMDKVMKVILGDNDSSLNNKPFEENSSDLEDIEEKISKRSLIGDTSSVASRRPVRKKTKPKNEDFEYDLSNLLKMEAQGYRDSLTGANSKSNQNKKKIQQENVINDDINKDCCGALAVMSKKAVENAVAQMKTSSFAVYTTNTVPRSSNIFVRPMLPKSISRGEKISPKKDIRENFKDTSSPSKVSKANVEMMPTIVKETKIDKASFEEPSKNTEKENANNRVQSIAKDDPILTSDEVNIPAKEEFKILAKDEAKKLLKNELKMLAKDNIKTVSKATNDISLVKGQNGSDGSSIELVKSNLSIPSVVPLKFGRQSLDLIKNPIINKNITDFTKAGMKTKILVIKPINRNKDGSRPMNTSLKFQTIKLKGPRKSSSVEDKSSDQVMVVKVPKVDSTIPQHVVDAGVNVTDSKVAPTIDASTGASSQQTDKISEDSNITKTVTECSYTEIKCDEVNKKCDSNNIESNANSGSASDTIIKESVTDNQM